MYTITGTSQLLSVPYALHAKTAEAVTNESQTIEQVLVLGNDANGNDIINTGQIKGSLQEQQLLILNLRWKLQRHCRLFFLQ
jgi:hypothetical protein